MDGIMKNKSLVIFGIIFDFVGKEGTFLEGTRNHVIITLSDRDNPSLRRRKRAEQAAGIVQYFYEQK